MSESTEEIEIVYAWPYLSWGGAQIYFFGLMKLVRDVARVTAVMPNGSAPRLLGYLQKLGIPCEFFDGRLEGHVGSLKGRILRRWRKTRCEWTLARVLGRRVPHRTILHLDIAPWSSFLLLFYLALRRQVFVTLHTALPHIPIWRFASWWLKFRLLSGLRKFHLFTSNRDTLESLRPFLSDAQLRRVQIAYSGVNVAEIQTALALPLDRGALCSQFGLPAEGLLVFALGQFIERKGCRTLLAAARELRDDHPEAFFAWIGTGDLGSEDLRLIETSRVADRFRHIAGSELGSDRLALLKLLRLADIFVLPSLQEGLPIALLEAMALGVPCIASDINAIPEAIQDNQTGLLVPPGNAGALAEAISVLAKDHGLRSRLAAGGRELVLAQFDERLSAEITLAQYELCWSGR